MARAEVTTGESAPQQRRKSKQWLAGPAQCRADSAACCHFIPRWAQRALPLVMQTHQMNVNCHSEQLHSYATAAFTQCSKEGGRDKGHRHITPQTRGAALLVAQSLDCRDGALVNVQETLGHKQAGYSLAHHASTAPQTTTVLPACLPHSAISHATPPAYTRGDTGTAPSSLSACAGSGTGVGPSRCGNHPAWSRCGAAHGKGYCH
ncbi:hypothetical protein TRVL_04662 [Trypanosoma vivax]|nr:hypothetical protein TRVL_04662 [Trypanosoma vivax]